MREPVCVISRKRLVCKRCRRKDGKQSGQFIGWGMENYESTLGA